MMPTVGALRTHAGFDETRLRRALRRLPPSTAASGSTKSLLNDSGIKAELTATTRASLQRYTFPASNQARVLYPFMLPNEYEMHILKATVRRTGNNAIEGTIETDLPKLGYVGDQRFDLHFVSQFSRPFDALGGWENLPGQDVVIAPKSYRPAAEANDWQGGKVVDDAPALDFSGDCGAFVTFTTRANDAIEVRTGISLVSVEDARLNLEQELARSRSDGTSPPWCKTSGAYGTTSSTASKSRHPKPARRRASIQQHVPGVFRAQHLERCQRQMDRPFRPATATHRPRRGDARVRRACGRRFGA